MVVPQACADAYPETPWACVLAEFNLPYTASDVFVSEMLLDSVQLFLHSGYVRIILNCFSGLLLKKIQRGLSLPFSSVPGYNKNTSSFVKRFGENMTKALSAYLFVSDFNLTQSPRRTGLFAASCFSHTVRHNIEFINVFYLVLIPNNVRFIPQMFSSKNPLLLDPLSNTTVSFIEVFADWLFERGQFSTVIVEDCCSSTEVKFNDLCPAPTPSRSQVSMNTSF